MAVAPSNYNGTDRRLKDYIRIDGNNRVIPGSNVKRRSMPKNGTWIEITSGLCCNPSTTVTPT